MELDVSMENVFQRPIKAIYHNKKSQKTVMQRNDDDENCGVGIAGEKGRVAAILRL